MGHAKLLATYYGWSLVTALALNRRSVTNRSHWSQTLRGVFDLLRFREGKSGFEQGMEVKFVTRAGSVEPIIGLNEKRRRRNESSGAVEAFWWFRNRNAG